jgi:LysR family transcriptional activator of nhaA
MTAKEGSIVKAAKVLNITPQTVSGQISTFEDYLGMQLFDRQGKRLLLNHQGNIAFRYAEDIFSLGHELLDTLAEKSEGRLSTFTIAVTDVVPKVLAFNLIKPVMNEFESTRLIYREGDLENLLADLAVNRVDMILADRPLTPGSNVKAFSHFLGETSVSFFASAKQTAIIEGSFPACLDGQPLLISSDKSSIKSNLLSWLERQKIRPKVIAEFDDSALLKLFGQEGFGIFCAPTSIEEHVSRQYQVECIGQTSAVTERYYAISPERKIRNELVLKIVSKAEGIITSL